VSAPFFLVVTTVEKRSDADRLAHSLVERGLAACAQIGAIDSVYAWQGAVERSAEFRILFKVAAGACESAERAIRAMHPYQLPAIHAIAVERADAPYAEWVTANSRPESDL
jgi:periplasmic divalent cation tolerance protein